MAAFHDGTRLVLKLCCDWVRAGLGAGCGGGAPGGATAAPRHGSSCVAAKCFPSYQGQVAGVSGGGGGGWRGRR